MYNYFDLFDINRFDKVMYSRDDASDEHEEGILVPELNGRNSPLAHHNQTSPNDPSPSIRTDSTSA